MTSHQRSQETSWTVAPPGTVPMMREPLRPAARIFTPLVMRAVPVGEAPLVSTRAGSGAGSSSGSPFVSSSESAGSIRYVSRTGSGRNSRIGSGSGRKSVMGSGSDRRSRTGSRSDRKSRIGSGSVRYSRMRSGSDRKSLTGCGSW